MMYGAVSLISFFVLFFSTSCMENGDQNAKNSDKDDPLSYINAENSTVNDQSDKSSWLSSDFQEGIKSVGWIALTTVVAAVAYKIVNSFEAWDDYFKPVKDKGSLLNEKEKEVAQLLVPEELKGFVKLHSAPVDKESLMKSYDSKYPRGYCMVGDPGNGKTYAAKYLASSLPDHEFIQVHAGNLLVKYVGDSEKNTRNLLAAVKKKAAERPVLVFIDEVDTIAKNRADKNSTSAHSGILTTLLQGLDGFNNTKGMNPVTYLVASNLPDSLDSAFVSRLQSIKFKNPNKAQRKLLFQLFLKCDVKNDVNFDLVADVTEGMSVRDISSCVINAKNDLIISQLPKLKDNFEVSDLRKITSFDVANAIAKINTKTFGETTAQAAGQIIARTHVKTIFPTFMFSKTKLLALKNQKSQKILDAMRFGEASSEPKIIMVN